MHLGLGVLRSEILRYGGMADLPATNVKQIVREALAMVECREAVLGLRGATTPVNAPATIPSQHRRE
jgi:hypothetical protein